MFPRQTKRDIGEETVSDRRSAEMSLIAPRDGFMPLPDYRKWQRSNKINTKDSKFRTCRTQSRGLHVRLVLIFVLQTSDWRYVVRLARFFEPFQVEGMLCSVDGFTGWIKFGLFVDFRLVLGRSPHCSAASLSVARTAICIWSLRATMAFAFLSGSCQRARPLACITSRLATPGLPTLRSSWRRSG